MLKTAIITAVLSITAISIAAADIGYVRSYVRKDGTFVQGHYRDTSGDGYAYNNRKAVWGW